MQTRDSSWRRVLLLVATAVLLPFCGGESVDSGSSESHFLSPCGDACEDGLTCICGVCTKPCETDATCSVLASGATCVSACDVSTQEASGRCELTCSADADCAALGAGYECAEGTCRTCYSRALQEVHDYVESQESCTADADCVSVSSPCYTEETCAAAVALRKGYDAGQWASLSSALADCAPEDSCVACQIAVTGPTCVGGRCELGALSCDERTAQAGARVQQALAGADKTCTSATDCTVVWESTVCSHSCSDVVSISGAATVQATIDDINGGLCATFQSDGCQVLIPPCVAPPQPGCVDGQCVALFGP